MYEISPGYPLPLGAVVHAEGVNFSLFTRNANMVTLLVYETAEEDMPIIKHELDPKANQTGDIWHCFIKGIKEGYWYGYFIVGDYEPKHGQRFWGI